MKTYRYRGHSRSDPAKYRPDGELERWKARDPITILGRQARRARASSTPPPRRGCARKIQADIDAAAERAATVSVPDPRGDAQYVYAD